VGEIQPTDAFLDHSHRLFYCRSDRMVQIRVAENGQRIEAD